MRRWNKVIFLGVTCLALAGCGKDRGDELPKDYQKNDELASDTSADADITGHLTYELVSDSGITFTVDADATGGGKLAESHCYGVKPVEVDEAYLKEHVYTIFDEGTLQQAVSRSLQTDRINYFRDSRNYSYRQIRRTVPFMQYGKMVFSRIWKRRTGLQINGMSQWSQRKPERLFIHMRLQMD